MQGYWSTVNFLYESRYKRDAKIGAGVPQCNSKALSRIYTIYESQTDYHKTCNITNYIVLSAQTRPARLLL